jgi:lipocalin
VGPDYSYSVVGGGSPKYLWILSRTPSLPQATMDGIFARLRERGYDLSDIILVEQEQ